MLNRLKTSVGNPPNPLLEELNKLLSKGRLWEKHTIDLTEQQAKEDFLLKIFSKLLVDSFIELQGLIDYLEQ